MAASIDTAYLQVIRRVFTIAVYHCHYGRLSAISRRSSGSITRVTSIKTFGMEINIQSLLRDDLRAYHLG